MAGSNLAEISTLERRFVLFLTDFSLRMLIFAVFLVSVEALMTDSESQTPISYSPLIVTGSIWISF